MVKLVMTALGRREVPGPRIRTALDLVHDASEITRRRLIDSGLNQGGECIGGDIRKKCPDIRNGEIRIVGSERERKEQKTSGCVVSG